MKSPTLSLLLFICSIASAHAQSFSDKIEQKLDFNVSTVVVKNIHGGIQVESYEGNEVLLEVNRNFSASESELIDLAKKELIIKTFSNSGTLFIELDLPCDETNSKWKRGWNGNGIWWNTCEWNPLYEFRLDFQLKVPANTNLVLSTIDKGDIKVKNVRGDIAACHIHGSILLDQLVGAVEVNTIHGDIKLNYAESPSKDSHYRAHHGDIEVNLPANSTGKFLFQSHDGDFFTDINDSVLKAISNQKRVEADSGEGISYRIIHRSGIQLRNGMVNLNFKTWHGDVYVREESE